MATMQRLARQFRHPHGPLGILAGLFMHRVNARRNEVLVDLAAPAPGDRVLDVGCGPGTAVGVAARRDGVRAAGVDVSGSMVRLARRVHRRLVRAGVAEFSEGSAEALPYDGGTFAIAWSMNSYHHWSDPPAGIRELLRVLRPGGRVLIMESLPNPSRRWGPPGMRDDDIARLVSELEGAGFEEVSARSHDVRGEPYVVARAVKPPFGQA